MFHIYPIQYMGMAMRRSSVPQAPVGIRLRPPINPAAPQANAYPRPWPAALGTTDTAHLQPSAGLGCRCRAWGRLQLASPASASPGQGRARTWAPEAPTPPAPRRQATRGQQGSSQGTSADTTDTIQQPRTEAEHEQRDKTDNTTAQETRPHQFLSYIVLCL